MMICAYKGCDQEATQLATGDRKDEAPAHYCEKHANKVSDTGSPEYIVDCPNCGCRFGV